MTDPITCPECNGTKGQRLGRLFLACQFCQGRGWVGGEYEPAADDDDGPPPPFPAAWEHRVWHDPVIAASIPCRYCLGARQVTHIDSAAGTVVTAACPVCSH